MFIDKKSLVAAALAFAIPALAAAQANFPFTVQRDEQGAVTRISLPMRTSVMMDEADGDTLSELKASLKAYQSSTSIASAADDVVKPETKDDKKLYEDAKAILKSDISMQTLEDVRLEREFKAAKSKVFKIELFRLLAAPNAPTAFDREKIVTEAIKQIIGAARSALPATQVFDVVEFLISEYIEGLESRREFFQNQLLVELAYDETLFTEKEKSTIRSSIFDSRISFINIPAKNKARKAWSTYGDASLAKVMKPCQGFVGANETGFGQCFKISGTEIANRMVKKSIVSKSVSLAFDSKNPTKVRNHRAVLLLAKLGLTLLPVPGLAKKPFSMWINSQYVNQRKSEGFLYGHAVQKGLPDLADWVLVNSANPMIRK